MANSLVKKKKTNLEVIKENIDNLITSKSNALPKGFNQTRFVQNAMTVLLDTKGINEMNPISVARTILKGAFLDLDFFRKECYAIPYGKELNFQTDYKGDIKIAKKYSIRPIREIFAKVVREDDEFTEFCEEENQGFRFTPKAFNNKTIIGAFATVLFEDGELLIETMSKEEIEDVRTQFSKAPNSPAWLKTPSEMYKKVVLKRLCKMIPLEFKTQEQQLSFKNADNTKFDRDYDNEIFKNDDVEIIEVSQSDITEISDVSESDIKEKQSLLDGVE